MTRAWKPFCLASTWALAMPGLASAAPLRDFRMTWSAPPECPQRRAVMDQLVAMLPPEAVGRALPVVIGQVTAAHGQYRLVLQLRDGDLVSERRFESKSCSEVVGAGVVSVALLLKNGDMGAGQAAQGDAPASGPALGGTSSGGTPSSPGTNDGAMGDDPGMAGGSAASSLGAAGGEGGLRPEAPQTGVGASPGESPASSGTQPGAALVSGYLGLPQARGAFGLTGGFSAGLGAGAGIEWEQWRLGAYGTFWLNERLPENAALQASLDRRSLGLLGCRWLMPAGPQLGLCLVAGVEWITVQAVGTGVVPISRDSAWFSGGAAVAGRIPLAVGWGIWGELGVSVQGSKPVLSVDGAGTVAQLGGVLGGLTVGLELGR